MTTEAIDLADMIDRSEETTGFERRRSALIDLLNDKPLNGER